MQIINWLWYAERLTEIPTVRIAETAKQPTSARWIEKGKGVKMKSVYEPLSQPTNRSRMKKAEDDKLGQLAESLRGVILLVTVPIARCLCGNYNVGQYGTNKVSLRESHALNLKAIGWEVKSDGRMFRIRCPECMEKGINKIVL